MSHAESAEAERDRARNLAASLEAECARLSETVARVEAYRRDKARLLGVVIDLEVRDWLEAIVKDLTAALTGPTETGD